jgi:GxxExxY protein
VLKLQLLASNPLERASFRRECFVLPRQCLVLELAAHGISAVAQRRIRVNYKNKIVGGRLELDLLIEGCLIVELKAVETIHAVHLAQVITYLKLTGCPAGLLINFNNTTLRAGLRRLDHPERYGKVPRPYKS